MRRACSSGFQPCIGASETSSASVTVARVAARHRASTIVIRDAVHFAHTLALVEELYVHHKRAEVITLSATHMVPDPKLSLAKEQVQIDFFRQHLTTSR